MALPGFLTQFIEESAKGIPLNLLKETIQQVSSKYRAQNSKNFLDSPIERISYLVTRFPATFKVNERVYSELRNWMGSNELESFLDVGSGPGTSLFALYEYYNLKRADLLEKDGGLIELCKKILEKSSLKEDGVEVQHITTSMQSFTSSTSYDLITLSYSLGEISHSEAKNVLTKLWNLTNKFIVLIEPGTPKGYQDILFYRTTLLNLGAHLVAPCPHSLSCPLKEKDWCHFGERVNRSSLHRQAKEADLGYEDEKYSYLIFSKEPLKTPESRVIRRPVIGKGHIQLNLCKKNGEAQEKIITKKEGDAFKRAKKVNWGDSFEL